jgi:hypothetical protein
MRGAIAGLLRRIWGNRIDHQKKCSEPIVIPEESQREVPRCARNDVRNLGGGFGAEDALETRAGELDADELFSSGFGIANMDYAAMRGEVCLVHSGSGKAVTVWGGAGAFGLGAARSVLGKGDSNFEVGADGDVETGDEGGAVAAEIFA